MRTNRLIPALVLTAVALGMAAWLVASVGDLHERIARHSPPLATAMVVASALAAAASALAAARLFWRMGRAEKAPARAPEDVIKAAEVQAEKAESVIARIQDESARARLNGELAAIREDRGKRQFHLVVFGTGSAGKTSLINALLGRAAGKVEATMGTTRHGENHTHVVEDVEGTLRLTDTPGLSEVGVAGSAREAEARDLAARADLLLFVVDGDLIRSEYEPLAALARQGKRSIVVLNKKDRYLPDDLAKIAAKLRERLAGVVPGEDVVAVAAAPRPVPLRVTSADGSVATVLEAEPPDLSALEARIAAVLDREGEALRAGNLLLRAHLVGKAAQEQLTKERDRQAKAIVERYQWVTAGAVFANPIPALDLMATGAVQFQMISEIAGAYGVGLSASHVKLIGGQMVQLLLKLGMVEAATSLVAGLFKSSLVGYAAGGALQGVTMAYLTHVSGLAFAEYFRRGQDWGDGGMQAALVRQFDLNGRADFLQEFARQALDRVVRRAVSTPDRSPPSRPG